MNNNKELPNYFQIESGLIISDKKLPNPDSLTKKDLTKHLWINLLGGDYDNFRVQFGFGNYIIEHQYVKNEKHKMLFKKIKSYLHETNLSVGLNNQESIKKNILISYLNINLQELYYEIYERHLEFIKFEEENSDNK